jgi:hypothetical protein
MSPGDQIHLSLRWSVSVDLLLRNSSGRPPTGPVAAGTPRSPRLARLIEPPARVPGHGRGPSQERAASAMVRRCHRDGLGRDSGAKVVHVWDVL